MGLTTKEYREYLGFQKDLDNFINEKIIEESDKLEKIKSIEAYRDKYRQKKILDNKRLKDYNESKRGD